MWRRVNRQQKSGWMQGEGGEGGQLSDVNNVSIFPSITIFNTDEGNWRIILGLTPCPLGQL